MPQTLNHDSLFSLQTEDAGRLLGLNSFLDELRVLLTPDDTQGRYAEAANEVDDNLCCPVTYEEDRLSHIPQDILEVDYGCGDPTIYAKNGDTVLDLGSGSGKHCFMLAKTVGESGRVIGVDKTPEMLLKSRNAVGEVMSRLGFAAPNVSFVHGNIENLRIDKDLLHSELEKSSITDYDSLEALAQTLSSSPLIPDESIDLVVSNCVLNLVADNRKRMLLDELYRVLKCCGSVAISDIVAEGEVTEEMKAIPDLWTGCLAGAWRRDAFHAAFEQAGFIGMQEVKSYFWKEVGGVPFHSVTIRAWKSDDSPCGPETRSALYRGPFAEVADDEGHVFERGIWTPVCDDTADTLSREPYAGTFEVSPADGKSSSIPIASDDCCGPSCC